MSDVLEACARAAYEAVVSGVPHESWEKLPEWWRRTYRKQAQAIIDTLQPGLVPIPAPTDPEGNE